MRREMLSLLNRRIGRRDLMKRLLAGTGTTLLTGRAVFGTRRPNGQTRTPDWTRLQNTVQGRVVPRGGPGYDGARHKMVWNALKSERFPDAIVHAWSEADVVDAVRFARQHGLKIAVRGGGHNWHNPALRQGGLLLDLSGLNQVRVDAGHRQAAVQPGVTGGALMADLAPHGLAFPIAHSAKVPVSGFLLNGGLGWNYRLWGPSCASIQALDIVNARGELIRAEKDRNADMFWAARGAGPGFFGVVTRFHLKLFPLPQSMLRSTLNYPVEERERVVAWLSQLVPLAAPVELGCTFSSRGVQIHATAFADSALAARKALQVLEAEPIELKPLRKSLYQEASVEEVFGRASTTVEPGPRYAGDSGWSNASPRELLSSVRDGLLVAPSGSVVQLEFLHHQDWPPQPDMAFSMFGSTYVHAHALWNDAAQDAPNQAWVRDTITSLEPLKVGHYVGEANLSVAPDRAKQCFSPAAWNRLNALKQKHDPDDVFFSYLR